MADSLAAGKGPSGTSATGPALATWVEWRTRCALGLCALASREELCDFAAMHFARFTRKYAHLTKTPYGGIGMGRGDAFHLLETYLTVRNTRKGKRYKEWLFDRAGEPTADGINSGAVLLMRDVTREFIRSELASARSVSLSTPIGGEEDAGLTLEDLLPGSIDPGDEVARREFARLATGHARKLVDGLSARERITLLAKHRGVSLAHPAVAAAAGCHKSVLNCVYRKFVARAVEGVRQAYPDEDVQSVRMLCLMTLDDINRLVVEENVSKGAELRTALEGVS